MRSKKIVNKETVTLLWISYVPGNIILSNKILKAWSTKSLMEAKTKDALCSLFGWSHSHARFKCACASIHAGIAHTPTLNILCVPMQGWAELICWLLQMRAHKRHGLASRTHTYTLHVCQPMWERWRKVGSQHRAPYPLQLIYLATLPLALHLTADLFSPLNLFVCLFFWPQKFRLCFLTCLFHCFLPLQNRHLVFKRRSVVTLQSLLSQDFECLTLFEK